MSEDGSVLFVHHMDLTSPFKATVPHHLPIRTAESRTVHVLCRKCPSQRTDRSVPEDVVMHDVDTGEVPIVSGLLYVVVSSLYALVLGAVYRYDAVYAFQHDMVQGWVAARAAGARFVVGLQSVPVRQHVDFLESGGGSVGLRDRLVLALTSPYLLVTGALLRRATVTCLTEGIRDVTESVYDVDLSAAHVIGMGVDVATFGGDAVRPDGARPDTLTVAYVGTISSLRGIGDLLEAVALVDLDVEVVLAGTGPADQVAALQARADELGVADRVEWRGLLAHEEIPRLLRSADVAVSPLSDVESYRISFPAKLLEYLAAGCPVVATDIPAHRRVVADGENGFLYEGGADGLAAALSTCAEADHQAMGRRARATAREYDWDTIAAKHEAVLFP